ncbi:glyoxylate/hydroxypyruvate reductase A [Roseovarius sp. MBR-6]|jgi:glyoxylate/hydroxypyruvate reductase A|uniref:2-hydroxyacid dehydrogenase n=1 Tax=Roseovarius sp. MBR-6 TaxID=3156459 RepID=UPI003397CCE0
MTANVLFAAGAEQWAIYRVPLLDALDRLGVAARVATDFPADEVDYIVYAPGSAVQDFTPFTRARAVLNLWAGVEKIVGNPTLHLPLARMVDHGLTQGMVEYVSGHVLRHHLGMDAHILRQDGVWRPDAPPLARDRRVSVLGLGALGAACARMLVALGFPVTGWSRRPREIAGLRCLSGEDGLHRTLAEADILVLLLPLTPETENLLDAARLALLPRGAVIVNPGRGPLIDDDALLAALDSGALGHATLDVFRVEPLPPAHPFWAHPRVTVTPHIASETRPDSAAEVIAENIRRGEAGEAFLYLVDPEAGY